MWGHFLIVLNLRNINLRSAAMHIKTHLDNALYFSTLQKSLSLQKLPLVWLFPIQHQMCPVHRAQSTHCTGSVPPTDSVCSAVVMLQHSDCFNRNTAKLTKVTTQSYHLSAWLPPPPTHPHHHPSRANLEVQKRSKVGSLYLWFNKT